MINLIFLTPFIRIVIADHEQTKHCPYDSSVS